MGIVKSHISVSLDGYVAGPNQSPEDPLGERGEELHGWVVESTAGGRRAGKEGGVTNASSQVMDESITNVGAEIMGRGMFGGGPGPWPEDPHGMAGERSALPHAGVRPDAPRARAAHPERPRSTSAIDGPEIALERARAAAGDLDVTIVGGAVTIDQYLPSAWPTRSSSTSSRSCSVAARACSRTSAT